MCSFIIHNYNLNAVIKFVCVIYLLFIYYFYYLLGYYYLLFSLFISILFIYLFIVLVCETLEAVGGVYAQSADRQPDVVLLCGPLCVAIS